MSNVTFDEYEISAGGWIGDVAGGLLGAFTGAGAGVVVDEAFELASGPAGWVMFGATVLRTAAGVASEY